MKTYFTRFLGILAFSLFSMTAFSQGQDKTVLFQGRVVASSNAEFLPLAYIFNPQAGRGALTDNFGQVDMYVFPGDSLVISYIGYNKKYYIVPRDTELVHQVIIHYLKWHHQKFIELTHPIKREEIHLDNHHLEHMKKRLTPQRRC
jgi:hypothetical protein